MSHRTKRALLGLAVAWLVAGAIVFVARKAAPSPERVLALVEQTPLASLSGPGREKHIARVADQVIRLDFEQRQQMRRSRELEGFFRALTQQEQTLFLEKTLPSGFRQMMEAFNEMPRERRQRMVDRALRDLRENAPEQVPELDDENLARMVDEGLRSFYNDSSAEVKLDLAPLIEEMQRSMRGLR